MRKINYLQAYKEVRLEWKWEALQVRGQLVTALAVAGRTSTDSIFIKAPIFVGSKAAYTLGM